MPAHEQRRILLEHKYPKREPQKFRTPYYKPAVTGILDFYRSGNQPSRLLAAKSRIEGLMLPSRRLNNNRVLDRFELSAAAKRHLIPVSNPRIHSCLGGVTLRLSPELRALEDGEERTIYINLRNEKLNEEVARLTLEIAHLTLEASGINVQPSQIEFIDLFSGMVHQIGRRRSKTEKVLAENADIMRMMWDAL